MSPAELTESRQPSVAAFRESIERHARYSLAQPWETLSPRQLLECLSLAVRDLMIDRRLETERRHREYFLVACAMRDVVARYQRDHQTFDAFSARVAVQLNDTHPALAVAELLRIVFIPDFRVSLAEVIIPAADLSEQISTAGSEASGTGNMKLAMNGALTIGTLDGANIEICEAVGPENMFIFGLTADRIQALRAGGSYRPRDLYQHDARLKRILDALDGKLFCPKEPGLFHWIVESILDRGDGYFHLADLPAYMDAQRQVDDAFRQPATWASKAILNVARIGRFSSDRTVAECAREIWGITRV